MPMTLEMLRALRAVRDEIALPVKHGVNEEYGYKYCREIDWYEVLAPELQKRGFVWWFTVDNVQDVGVSPTGRQRVVRVELTMHIAVEVDGQYHELSIKCAGEGADPTDKAVYKAITGAKKYGYAQLFALPTADDPEAFRDNEESNGTAPHVPLQKVLDAIDNCPTVHQLTAYWNRAKQVVSESAYSAVKDAICDRLYKILNETLKVASEEDRAIWQQTLKNFSFLGERVKKVAALFAAYSDAKPKH